MLLWENRRSWALPLAALLFGCAPKIGNRCTLSTDCSQLGDRLCDVTQPDGYCTIFNCEPDTCPDAVCVGFNAQLDPACGDTAASRTPRFERTFCMQPCSDDSDCREQYKCASKDEAKFEVVDLINNPPEQKICIAGARSSKDAGPSMDNESRPIPNVCGVGDAGAEWTPYDAGVSDAGVSDGGESDGGMSDGGESDGGVDGGI